MRRGGSAALLVIAGCALARDAHADCAPARPTDPGGYVGIEYGSDPVASYDTPEGRVRIFHATAGSDAPLTIQAAEKAGHVVEEAIDGYAAMGFVAPLGDGDFPVCASNGGDGRLDVYLIGMGGADGQAATQVCTAVGKASRCAGFVIAESRLEEGYSSFDEGARTVLPHEVFHLVQDAYDAEMDRWWAEGTAQWATKQLHPELTDLERFLPAYFSETSRSLDAPPGGVVQGFLYATAIWPVFLGERHGPAIVREIMEAIALGANVLDATDSVLAGKGSSLAVDFTTFATWNVATGTRAGQGGYPLAATYPMVKTAALAADAGASASGVTSGLAALYYAISAEAPREVSLDTDPSRNAAVVVPLAGGVADLARVKPLPAIVTGEAIIVVAGQSALKTDAPFTIHVREPVKEGEVPETPHEQPPVSRPMESDQEGGCSIGPRLVSERGWLHGALVMVSSLATAARRTRRTRFRRR